MIRVVASTSGVSAKAYFSSGLARADYYTDEIIGKWHGHGANYLGLSDDVQEVQFTKLIENTHPLTDEKLNPRVNNSRTVGWDINFHAPKSVSLAISLGKDSRLLEAFRESVVETMADIEAQTETRIRVNGASEDRKTGNLCWAEFVHLTARPIGGIPDPHTHVHAYVFNTTFDPVEGRWKAAKISAARREMPLHQARFHARLALRAKALGYNIKRTRNGWELAGLERTTLDKYSRRTAEIERLADELHLNNDASKDKLGALTREGKRRGLTAQELDQAWKARLTAEEQTSIKELTTPTLNTFPTVSAKEAIDHAIEKVFARDAVVRRSRLLSEALRFGVGHLSPAAIEREYQKRPIWEKDYNGDILITHDKVLSEEIALVNYVRSGKGRHSALVSGKHRLKRDFLSDEQAAAVNHILSSNDRVIAMRGGAGTGKTTTMQEVVEAIESTGITVYALAPSADASRDTLRKAGFENADTVAQFLTNPQLHQEARSQVIWVDEAGLLGSRDLHAITEKAGPDTRIILTGDTFQHAPVARGNAFRNLQQFTGLKPVEISEIRRQEPATYREAVYDLSQKDLGSAFLKLDAMGAIHEVPDHNARYERLATDYTDLSKGKHVPLVVSPTRREGQLVTDAIRNKLKQDHQLEDERVFPRYRNLQWESADKKEPENYFPGLMLQYHQNGKGIKRGARFQVSDVSAKGEIQIKDSATTKQLNLQEAEKFQVFATESIPLARGDRIRITRNGFSLNKTRHSNGNIREIDSFTPEGNLKLTTGAILDQNDGHWTHGYCTTSHASQSKSVKDVLIAQSSESLPASSQEQFYVSVSRGKERIIIYTDDREALQESVGISEKSRSALELARDSGRKWNNLIEKELDRQGWKEAVKEKAIKKPTSQETPHNQFRTALKPSSFLSQSLEQRRLKAASLSPKESLNRTTQSGAKHQTHSRRITQRFYERLRSAKDWMKSTSLLRNAQQKYQQIRAFTKKPPNIEKSPIKTSVKQPRKAIVQRSVVKR